MPEFHLLFLLFEEKERRRKNAQICKFIAQLWRAGRQSVSSRWTSRWRWRGRKIQGRGPGSTCLWRACRSSCCCRRPRGRWPGRSPSPAAPHPLPLHPVLPRRVEVHVAVAVRHHARVGQAAGARQLQAETTTTTKGTGRRSKQTCSNENVSIIQLIG